MRLKMNKVIYNKLLLQAEEAKEQGMTKLASNVLDSIGAVHSEELEQYSYDQLEEDIQKDMWKMATRLMAYYDLQSVDAEKVDKTLSAWASKIINDLEVTFDVDSTVKGPSEPKIPGETE